MKQEMIHDALNLLDDGLIEAVDTLRASKRKRKLPWVRWMPLAACLCLLAGLAFFFPHSAENTASDGIFIEVNTSAEQEAESPNEMSNGSSAAGSMTGDPLVTVQIDSWQPDGFLGTITAGGIWETATVIKVMFEEAPISEAEFPVGTVVSVRFSRSEQTDGLCTVYAKEILSAE